MDCGTEVNHKDDHGCTWLMWATALQMEDIVRMIVARGGENLEVDARNDDGDTALMIATYIGSLAIVRCLVEEADADIHIPGEKGLGPADWAARNAPESKIAEYFTKHQQKLLLGVSSEMSKVFESLPNIVDLLPDATPMPDLVTKQKQRRKCGNALQRPRKENPDDMDKNSNSDECYHKATLSTCNEEEDLSLVHVEPADSNESSTSNNEEVVFKL